MTKHQTKNIMKNIVKKHHVRNMMHYCALLILPLMMLTACSETNDEEVEFPNWKETNERAFAALYNMVAQNTDPTSPWKLFNVYSKTEDMNPQMEDYIVVREITRGKVSGSPLFTDSVSIHYRGRLLPSTTYTEGYIFDSSWQGEYNPDTMTPFESLPVSSYIDGFATALQHMQIGDRWEVYVPYQLAYGSTAMTNPTIPAYSMLIFDVTLVGYKRK